MLDEDRLCNYDDLLFLMILDGVGRIDFRILMYGDTAEPRDLTDKPTLVMVCADESPGYRPCVPDCWRVVDWLARWPAAVIEIDRPLTYLDCMNAVDSALELGRVVVGVADRCWPVDWIGRLEEAAVQVGFAGYGHFANSLPIPGGPSAIADSRQRQDPRSPSPPVSGRRPILRRRRNPHVGRFAKEARPFRVE